MPPMNCGHLASARVGRKQARRRTVYGPTAAQVAVSSRVPKRMSAIDAMVSGTQNETMPSAVGLEVWRMSRCTHAALPAAADSLADARERLEVGQLLGVKVLSCRGSVHQRWRGSNGHAKADAPS